MSRRRFASRLSLALAAALLVAQVAVGQAYETILVTGQSQAVGQGDSAQSVNLGPEKGREYSWKTQQAGPYYGSGFFRNGVSDPMSRQLTSVSKSNTGSIVPALVQAIADSTGKQVQVFHYAVNSTGLYNPPGGNVNMTWQPGSNYTLTRERGCAGMMRALYGVNTPVLTPRWRIILLGEKDGGMLLQYQATYKSYPDSMVVDSAYDLAGNFTAYPAPRGYPNPQKLTNAYSLFYRYYKDQLATGSNLIVVGTGRVFQTGNAAGARMMHWIEQDVVNALRAEGYDGEHVGLPGIYFIGDTFKWVKQSQAASTGLPGYIKDADGTHYTQAGLNYLGVRCARIIIAHP